jgi:hypothetical protein
MIKLKTMKLAMHVARMGENTSAYKFGTRILRKDAIWHLEDMDGN